MKRLSGVGSDVESSSALRQPTDLKPWEDRSLSPNERFEGYKAFVHEKLAEIAAAFDRAGEANDTATQKEIMKSSEAKQWMEEGAFLKTASAEEFCKRIDGVIPELLAKNFLGAEAWKSQGIYVGEVPPIPQSITKSLLESECPFHPGEKIKDTHLLVLVPKTVDGEPLSPLKLDELCAARRGSGNKLIYDGQGWATQWKKASWASVPQSASEWVLIPKSDPAPGKVPDDKHFRSKDIASQQRVHEHHYPEYREVRAIELMTMVLLNDLVNKERLLPQYLRCEEPNASGGRVDVGQFDVVGLSIRNAGIDNKLNNFGRALARKI